MINRPTPDLYQKGFLSEIDVHFARFIARLSGFEDPDLFLAAALVSQAAANGDVCLDLSSAAGRSLPVGLSGMSPTVCPEPVKWREKLRASPAVGKPGEFCPLILDEQDRLYLYRYWEYEKTLSDSIKKRVKEDLPGMDWEILRSGLKRLFPKEVSGSVNWQKIASLIAVLKKFCVISGGPGTGKTFTVAKILALLLEQSNERRLRIFLSAPTGKAAARLQESLHHAKKTLNCSERIKSAIPEETYTLHRMLKPVAGTPYFQHTCEKPLPADVVVVDEASMVDIALMSKLAQAVPPDARLILIGDKDQLASVEAGSVLGDICGGDNFCGFSKTFSHQVRAMTGEDLPPFIRRAENRPDLQAGLQDCIVVLQQSYRFSEISPIGGLSRSVNLGDFAGAFALLKNTQGIHSGQGNLTWEKMPSPADLWRVLEEKIREEYSAFLVAEDPSEALEQFNRFKILCAIKKGPFGVETVNSLAERVLSQEGLIRPDKSPDSAWYRGRPVLITQNDHALGLYNGDIGITWPVPDSDRKDLHVFFPGGSGGLRCFSPHRLPEHETVYAMTVHKSQGSEFDNVLLILPDQDFPLLTKELIYTGITRARKEVAIWANEAILRASILRKINRTSGLRDALWNRKTEYSDKTG